MIRKHLQRAAALLLAAALFPTASAAAPAAYTMTLLNGCIAVRDNATGAWVYRSDIRAELLSQRDQLLLETGIALQNQADFTRAVEDFCS